MTFSTWFTRHIHVHIVLAMLSVASFCTFSCSGTATASVCDSEGRARGLRSRMPVARACGERSFDIAARAKNRTSKANDWNSFLCLCDCVHSL